MKLVNLSLILILVAGVLAGCGGDGASSSDEQASSAQALEESAGSETYTSKVLDVSHEGALPASSQLALGTFELEETENAVTLEQAETLLPLWQAIQGGSLQSDAETNAVLKQIEGTLTAEQWAVIAAMQLTFEEMGAWMKKRGVDLDRPQGAAVAQGGFGDMSEEERAAMRATAQAGGGRPGEGGPFGDDGLNVRFLFGIRSVQDDLTVLFR